MGSIRVLPDDLANKIAAGEVVERPASVVKELVENALDAGARSITVTVADGGRSLVRVEDDGSGMAPEDARLCLERHATSKIRETADLFRIQTLGFRGEALPSIASVCRLTLVTVPRDGGEGTRIVADGGAVLTCQPAAAAPGTSLTIEDLFFNTPARRKFLRSPETELSHLTRVVTSYALAHPEVAFALVHGGRSILDLAAAPDLAFRCRDALPRDSVVGATTARHVADGLAVEAFLPPLSTHRAGRDHQYLFVNRRVVKDRVISHAIQTAYEDLVPRGRHPAVVLFLEMDPARVDVNVHPTKAEVRFQDSRGVHVTIARILRDAYAARGEVAPLPASAVAPGPHASGAAAESGAPGRLGFGDGPQRPTDATWGGADVGRAAVSWTRPLPPCPRDERSTEGDAEAPLPGELPRIIGHFRRTFLVAVDASGLLLIDQHVAHERVLFEKAHAALVRGGGPRQPLLLPEVVELSAGDAALVVRHREDLARLGFLIEDFGPQAFALREVPPFLKDASPRAVFAEVLADLAAGESSGPVDAARHALAASIACRAAIKARRRMTPEEQSALVRDLYSCDDRFHCPHGRPIMMRLGYDQIARHFERH